MSAAAAAGVLVGVEGVVVVEVWVGEGDVAGGWGVDDEDEEEVEDEDGVVGCGETVLVGGGLGDVTGVAPMVVMADGVPVYHQLLSTYRG